MILLLCVEMFAAIVIGVIFCCRSQGFGGNNDTQTSGLLEQDEVQVSANEEKRLIQ
jgi:hypothetical protein